jgi:hypothetical protein
MWTNLIEALRPGGVLIYETFTVHQTRLGTGPKNPAHLLQDGELELLVRPLEVLRQRDGEHHGILTSQKCVITIRRCQPGTELNADRRRRRITVEGVTP